MNKRLEELLEQVPHWPPDFQEDAVAALEGIAATLVENASLTPREQEAKVASLRETLRKSIERGGSHTDEDVEASVSAALDTWERNRKSA